MRLAGSGRTGRRRAWRIVEKAFLPRLSEPNKIRYAAPEIMPVVSSPAPPDENGILNRVPRPRSFLHLPGNHPISCEIG